ncbi:PREDICTED: uncharacterized protein LOC104588456 [Nelumbo nucifera]|uniref:Uncharacterized protein LOC104588456 n=2 Tax=Nelumbo nucifera TaxID=4432 RepID=A0A1U7ZBQ5_NELNU|nr:PREDICTED: uncharacterized protein LOC104588456 [Nelumbo nucifera]DAD22186.1 TPA_asm: hypothetical protein HUJ06_023649 [Nelumbo nucifera]
MEISLTYFRRLFYFSSCVAPPSCLHSHKEYSRVPAFSSTSRSQKWRNLLRKLVRESKSICGSKPLTFHYDAESYYQNFDDGFHNEDSRSRVLLGSTSSEFKFIS